MIGDKMFNGDNDTIMVFILAINKCFVSEDEVDDSSFAKLLCKNFSVTRESLPRDETDDNFITSIM